MSVTQEPGSRSESAPSWRIDAHQHYWELARGDYFWMPREGQLARDYLPGQLAPENSRAEIGGTILVQAAPTTAESEFLLHLADSQQIAPVLGVVGWVDLEADPSSWPSAVLDHPLTVGVRPMIQDLERDDWIGRPAVRRGLAALAERGLAFDLLCRPRHLEHAIPVLEAADGLRVVVDHLAKPAYGDVDRQWADQMRELARRPGTYCKLAGLVTERGPGWQSFDFTPFADVIFGAFGTDRVMIGTDWPVHLPDATHAEVVALAESLVCGLSRHEYDSLWRGACAAAYRLPRTAAGQSDPPTMASAPESEAET